MSRSVIPAALVAAALAACRPPAPAAPAAPTIASLTRWIPADAIMAIVVVDHAGAAPVDALARAVRAPSPLEHVAPPPELAAIATRGRVWMLLDGEAGTIARCAEVRPPADPAAALGGTARRAGSATIVDTTDAAIVLDGGFACVVTSGVRSRRDHHAVRLATLAADERLAPTAVDAVATAPVIVWGRGDVIGAGLDDTGEGLAAALARRGTVAIGARVEAGALRAEVVGAAPTPAPSPDAAPPAPAPPAPASAPAPDVVAVGPYAEPPPVPPPAPLPVPPVDENVDVPESPEHRATVARLAQTLAAAVETASALEAAAGAARAAWITAWGTATVTTSPDASRAALTWRPPAPAAELRARADRAFAAAAAPIAELRARHDALVADAAARIAELVRIRARDVAAHDRLRR